MTDGADAGRPERRSRRAWLAAAASAWLAPVGIASAQASAGIAGARQPAGIAVAQQTAGIAVAPPAGDAIQPFAFRAGDDALADLKRRLDQTRWPERDTGTGWEQGPPLPAMRALVDHWRGRYDWRRAEAELARWPQFRTTIDGLAIHFIHVRSPHPDARPMILTHGWPSTVQLFREVIAPLVDPVAHGGKAEDAFDVVIPSLPGYAFSDKPVERGWNAGRVARAWAVLMRRLGYERYVAQGGDWGAYVTTAMAQQRPPGLEAIHLNFAQTMPDRLPKALQPDQQKAVASMRRYLERDSAYAQVQATRPQLIGYALLDSPVGQAAWLYDIFNGGSGNTGDPDAVLGRDWMLDEITLYWLTGTAASSARLYLEQAAAMGKRHNPGRVELPVGVSVFPHDLQPARSWARAVYPRLFYWHELDRGGHFCQVEAPDLFVGELRRCFAEFRHPRRPLAS